MTTPTPGLSLAAARQRVAELRDAMSRLSINSPEYADLCRQYRAAVAATHPRPHVHPQMHVLTRRLLELDTSPDGNNRRAHVYNQRRRELDELGSGPRWWILPYHFNSFLLAPYQVAPTIYYARA